MKASNEDNGEDSAFILPTILECCEDFQNELTALEYLAVQLCDEACTVKVFFTPKYHCKLAGYGIELAWGYSKHYYQCMIPAEKKKNEFDASVREALSINTLEICCKFNNHVGKYRLAYKHFENKDNKRSYQAIKCFVKQYKTHWSSADAEAGYINSLIKETFGGGNSSSVDTL